MILLDYTLKESKVEKKLEGRKPKRSESLKKAVEHSRWNAGLKPLDRFQSKDEVRKLSQEETIQVEEIYGNEVIFEHAGPILDETCRAHLGYPCICDENWRKGKNSKNAKY